MRRHTAIAGALLAIASLGWPSAPARAHEQTVERAVAVQVHREHVDVMVVVDEPASERTALLKARFDVNRDGRIDGPEAQLAAAQLLPSVLGGLQFEVVGERPEASDPELKVVFDKKGGMQIAAFARYRVARLEAGKARRVAVRLLKLRGAAESHVSVLAGEGMALKSVEPAQAKEAGVRPVALGAGGEIVAAFGVGEAGK